MSDEMKHMDCQDIKALLSALVDDEVDASTRHRAERHLAGCAACRRLLDEAESLDKLVAGESAALVGSALPAGFEATVIERAAQQRQGARRVLVTWTGWFAAAACLILAVLIWSFDRQLLIDRNLNLAATDLVPPDGARGTIDSNSTANVVRTAGYQRRSWTFDGDLPNDALVTDVLDDGITSSDDGASADLTLSRVQPPSVNPAFVGGAPDAGAVGRAAAALAAGESNLTSEDVRTLHSVSLVMETLELADLNSFAEVERIRRITEYDELLPRLEELKPRLSAADRAAVRIAESILLRIVRGPITEQSARELRADASDFGLSQSLHAIGNRFEAQPTL